MFEAPDDTSVNLNVLPDKFIPLSASILCTPIEIASNSLGICAVIILFSWSTSTSSESIPNVDDTSFNPDSDLFITNKLYPLFSPSSYPVGGSTSNISIWISPSPIIFGIVNSPFSSLVITS